MTKKSLVELRQLFDKLDKDQDGNVTAKEWGDHSFIEENQTLLAKYFGGGTLKEIGSAFKRIDTDGNASLSWEEFVAAAGLSLAVALHYSTSRELPPAAGLHGQEDLREQRGLSDDDLRRQTAATIDAGIRLSKEAARRKSAMEEIDAGIRLAKEAERRKSGLGASGTGPQYFVSKTFLEIFAMFCVYRLATRGNC